MRPRLGSMLERLLNERLRRVRLAFLDQRAGHVQPAVGIAGLGLGVVLERVLGALQIALQQQADAPVVPALAVLLLRSPASTASASCRRPRRTCAVASASDDDRQVRDLVLDLARDVRRDVRSVERVLEAVVAPADQRRILARLRLAGVGELRVVVRELAVVQLRREA